jgi:hypothetical protein
MLRQLGCIVTPDTILRWYRELIARLCGATVRNPLYCRARGVRLRRVPDAMASAQTGKVAYWRGVRGIFGLGDAWVLGLVY